MQYWYLQLQIIANAKTKQSTFLAPENVMLQQEGQQLLIILYMI